jgi:hypothetical protein
MTGSKYYESYSEQEKEEISLRTLSKTVAFVKSAVLYTLLLPAQHQRLSRISVQVQRV